MNGQIIYLAINLPSSEERRRHVEQEAAKAGIDVEIVPAVAGNTLTDEQKARYDAAKRSSLYERHLAPNEQACVLSHRKCLRRIVDSGAAFGVVLEDDVTFSNNFREVIHFLTEKLKGWECAKLYTAPCRLYPLMPPIPDAPVQPVFPKKMPWGAIGYLYSRHAALKILKHLDSFYLPADLQLAQIILDYNIPFIGVTPNVVGTLYPHNEQSDINVTATFTREKQPKRTLMQYLRYRADVIQRAFGKWNMRHMMKSRLRVES